MIHTKKKKKQKEGFVYKTRIQKKEITYLSFTKIPFRCICYVPIFILWLLLKRLGLRHT